MLQRQARVGSYGSWYQYYLCDIDAKIIMPKFNDKAIDALLVHRRGQAQRQPLAVQHGEEM